MIQGYPRRASVRPGEQLTLHVSTDAPRFRVRFYRWGDGFVPVSETGWYEGRYAEDRGAADDWNWPAYDLAVPADWPSGVYLAFFEAENDAFAAPSFAAPAALVVVRGSGRSPLLYKIPLATYHAYNFSGGGCFYVNPPRSHDPPGSKVSLLRPGGGIGGETWGALDDYDLSSPRQTFAHWDAHFIRWLVRRGYDAEFCTDLDVHDDPSLCERYRLLVSVGHDEYWTETTRDRVEAFAAAGGNVAFFGANLCWWRIHLVDGGTAIVCHQGGPRGALDHWWPPTGANRPEDALTGVSYRHGGGWWDGPRRTHGFYVQQPEHWAFAGTGLRRGDAFGAETTPPLVGYECDGAPLAYVDPIAGLAELAPDAGRYGTPSGFRVLAAGPLGDGWQELPPREGLASREGVHAAVIGAFTTGGTTFTTGTTDWAQVLASGDRTVETITRNVIEHLREGVETIRTERLDGRRPTRDDYALIRVTDADWEVQRSLFGTLPTEEESADRLERFLRVWEEHGYGMWLLFERDGAFVGHAGLFPSRQKPGETEIGYVVVPSRWGRGYATEIVSALVRIAFERLRLQRLVAHTDPANAASRRVLEKAGFRLVGESLYDGRLPTTDYALDRAQRA